MWQSAITTLQELIAVNSAIFQQGPKKELLSIPSNQRMYVWDKNNITSLFDDILEVLNSRQKQQFFCGTIVLANSPMSHIRDNFGNTMNMDVIDGQQRIITLVITLSIVSNILKKYIDDLRKRNGNLKIKINKFYNRYITKIDTSIQKDISQEDLIVLRTPVAYNQYFDQFIDDLLNSDQRVENIIDKYKNSTLHESWQNIINNATEIYETLKQNFFDLNKFDANYINDLENIITFIFNDIRFNILVTDDFKTGFRVFRSINGTGEELKPEDYIKNDIVSRINNHINYQQVEQKWNTLIDNLKINGKYYTTPIDFFYYYILTFGKFINNKDDIYDEFCKLTESNTYINLSNDNDILSFLDKLIFYSDFLKTQQSQRGADLDLIKFTLGYPILLALNINYITNNQTIFDNIVKQITRMAFILMICKKTKEIKDKVIEIIKIINKSQLNNILNDIKNEVDNIAKTLQNDFKKYLDLFKVGRGTDSGNKFKYMAIMMSEKLSNSRFNFSGYEIEHILPWKLNNNCTFNKPNEYDEYKMSVGNCTIVHSSYNKNLSNNCFGVKYTHFNAPGNLHGPLTTSIAFGSINNLGMTVNPFIQQFNYKRKNHPSMDWTSDDIEERAQALINLADYIWIQGNI